MFIFTLDQIFYLAVLFLSLTTVVITFGVVWRVEKKLDISYKFLLLAVIVFTFGVFFDNLSALHQIKISPEWEKLIKALFIIFFTLGVFEMRTLVIEAEERAMREKKKVLEETNPKVPNQNVKS
ncbi:MAG: hypothetical protein V1892_03765 [bacterium]